MLLHLNFHGDQQSFLEEKDIDAVFVVANIKSQRYFVFSVCVAPQSPSKLMKFPRMLDTAVWLKAKIAAVQMFLLLVI